MASGTEPVCNLCDKHGLLIMPVRYAIAPRELGLPVVTAPLKVEDVAESVGKGKKQDVQLKESAQYTTRVMRSGYLYVYDEMRDRMQSYWITSQGNFMSFPAETTIPEQAKSATPCDFAGHKELAGCIAINDVEHAGIVWLGFSDVQWTPAVVKAHQGKAGHAQRTLHMRAFDAGAWAKAHKVTPGIFPASDRGSVPHVVGLTNLGTTVAEYASVGKSAQGASASFKPSTAPNYHARAGQASAVLESCARRSPKLQAAIVALDDPAGIAQDLAALIQWHFNRLLDTPVSINKFGKGYGYATSYRNLVALDGSLKALKSSNDEKVKLEIFANRDALADALKVSYDVGREQAAAIAVTPSMASRPGVGSQSGKTQTLVDIARQHESDKLVRNPTPEFVEKTQSYYWNQYLERTIVGQKNGPYASWRKEFKGASDALMKEHTKPLSQVHAAWMQSNLLANKLESTHDGAQPLSGDVYAATLYRCISGTQQVDGCRAVYENWLRGDVRERTNLLLRAFLLKQDDLIAKLAVASLDPQNVPWQTLMDQYAAHMKALLKPDVNAPAVAAAAQRDEAKAKKTYEEATTAYFEALGTAPGLAFMKSPIKRKMEEAKAAWENAQAQADSAKQNTNAKLLPDSVATVLTYVSAPFGTMLREFNGNAAEKKLMQWMVIAGVTMRTPVGVIEVNGTVQQSIKFLSQIFVDNLVAAGKQSGNELSEAQIRQLRTYAERQVRGSFASGNVGAFETQMGSSTKSKMAVFITPQMYNELDAIKDPTKKVAWLVEHVKTPKNLQEYGLMRIGSRIKLYGAVSEGVLTVVDAICKYATWQQAISDEASALKFQKTWTLDARATLCDGLFLGALASGAGNVLKMYGAWRNAYAVGMPEMLAGEKQMERAAVFLKFAGVLGGILAGVYAVMDLVDGFQSRSEGQRGLAALQLTSGGAGVVGAGIAIWAALAAEGGATIVGSIGVLGATFAITLTFIGFVLAAILAALALWIGSLKGDSIAQWMSRSYWGSLGDTARYPDFDKEQSDFKQLMAGA
ncbi:T6SS effector BTH_I2691 family protein [Caballeronia sp. LZ025]|uniref:T6SS effector BTH_I2691 family protein n=1 Tax=Caballeronia sp. LZ025 TaxID=3038562 RepID=UPI00285E3E42|nr:T6SS effector BTH_I2691 family protein [Caballeronia sp. LZ025]MDR5735840.1 T6SS effector BTH_I2691 family protein [Caballeronia sp. LZ025]